MYEHPQSTDYKKKKKKKKHKITYSTLILRVLLDSEENFEKYLSL